MNIEEAYEMTIKDINTSIRVGKRKIIKELLDTLTEFTINFNGYPHYTEYHNKLKKDVNGYIQKLKLIDNN